MFEPANYPEELQRVLNECKKIPVDKMYKHEYVDKYSICRQIFKHNYKTNNKVI